MTYEGHESWYSMIFNVAGMVIYYCMLIRYIHGGHKATQNYLA